MDSTPQCLDSRAGFFDSSARSLRLGDSGV
jgi:hypothetical protein